MVQELLNFLPTDLTTLGVGIAAGGMIVGVIVWLIGARYSRTIVALSGVCAGGILGMVVPRQQGWPVNTMATSVGSAVALGMIAFALHRMWIGIALGLLLACWAALGTWTIAHGEARWEMPAKTFASDLKPLPQYAREEIWDRLPDPVRSMLPYTCGTAMVIGLGMAVMSAKLARTALFSVLGVTLLVGLGLTFVQAKHVDWLRYIPAPTISQVGILVGLTLFGVIVQWQVLPAARPQRRPAAKREEREVAGMFSSSW